MKESKFKKKFSKIINFFTSIIKIKSLDSEYQKYLDNCLLNENNLSKTEFYKKRQENKYNNINKCC